MEPATILMLLVTCSPDLLLCREETQANVRYENMKDCQDKIPSQIARLSSNGRRAFAVCHPYGDKPYKIGEDSFWHVSADGDLKALFSIGEIRANTLPRDPLPKPKPRNTHPKGTVHVTRYNEGARQTSSYDFRNKDAAEESRHD